MHVSKDRPPKLGEWLLKKFLLADECHEKLGDFEEGYHLKAAEKGKHKAYAWYWLQLIKAIPVFINNLVYWRSTMFNNYLKIAFRNLRKHKGYSFINIFGLAIGITCFILIILYVQYEYSFDKFHEKSDRIYRIAHRGQIIDNEVAGAHNPAALSETLLSEYPEVEQAIKIQNRGSILSIGEKSFKDNVIIAADPEFLAIFNFPLIAGDPYTVLSQPNSAVITKATAEKHFGSEDPVNKTIRIREIDFKITGILNNIPENSHLQFNILLTLDSFPDRGTPWNNHSYFIYILLQEGYNPDVFEQKLDGIVKKYVLPPNPHFKNWEYFLEPLEDIHLRSKLLGGGNSPPGDILYVYVFSCIAFFILLIACVNFMVLSTAKSSVRAKEIGIRKIIGSNRTMIVKQFLSESFLTCLFAMLIAVILAACSLPAFRILTGKNIELNFLNYYYVIPGLVVIALFVSLFSGSYPAFYLSSLQAVNTLKDGAHFKNKRNLFRNILVIFQFSITVILIVSSLIIFNQLKFFQSKNLGFIKDQKLIIHDVSSLAEKYGAFKETIKQYPNILTLTGSSTIPGSGTSKLQITPENSARTVFDFLWCDYNFLKTMEIELAAGRFFSPKFGSDRNAIVINEVVAEEVGWSDPVGKKLK